MLPNFLAMKWLLALVLLVISSLTVNAEFRTWTQASTKKTIQAKLVEKDETGDTVTLMLTNLKTVNLAVSNLIDEDQKFIKEWTKPIDPKNQLTVRLIQSGKYDSYTKKLEVDVVAGNLDVTVSGGCHGGCNSLNNTVAAGKTETFTITTHDAYSFTLTDSLGNLLDHETPTKKTGITKLR